MRSGVPSVAEKSGSSRHAAPPTTCQWSGVRHVGPSTQNHVAFCGMCLSHKRTGISWTALHDAAMAKPLIRVDAIHSRALELLDAEGVGNTKCPAADGGHREQLSDRLSASF